MSWPRRAGLQRLGARYPCGNVAEFQVKHECYEVDIIVLEGDLKRLDTPLGEHLLGLLEERAWLRRRVDTVSFVDEDSSIRQSTFDIDTTTIAATLPSGAIRAGFVVAPLMMLEKQLLVDSDLKDDNGRALHIATRREDSYLSWCILGALAKRNGVDLTKTPLVADALHPIMACFPKSSRRDIREVAPEWWLPSVPGWTEDDTRAWDDLFRNLSIREWIHQVTYGFLLATYLPVNPRITIVKFSARADVVFPQRLFKGLPARMGWFPAGIEVPVAASGEAERRHLRLRAPDGLEWSRVSVKQLVVTLRRSDNRQLSNQPKLECQVLFTPDRAHVYVMGQEQLGSLIAIFGLHVPTRGFLRAGLLSSFLNAAILGAGVRYHPNLVASVRGNIEAAVTILLLAPTLFTAYLVRPGEHALLGKLMRWSRYTLVASMGSIYVAAIGTLIYLPKDGGMEERLWLWCFIAAATCFALQVAGFTSSWIQALGCRRYGIRRGFKRRSTRTRTVTIGRRVSTTATIESPPPPRLR
jgi:hypothetical protein